MLQIVDGEFQTQFLGELMRRPSDFELYDTKEDSSSNKGAFGHLDSAEYYTHTGHIAKGVLNSDTEIDGWVFKAGTVLEFHANGRVYHGTLAVSNEWYETPYSVYYIKKDHRVFFYDSGVLSSGRNFYEGRLGGPYRLSVVEGGVSFRGKGQLFSIYVSGRDSVSVAGTSYLLKANSYLSVHEVDLYRNSSVQRCEFVGPVDYLGFLSDPLYPVEFWEGPSIFDAGPVSKMWLSRDVIEQGYHILGGNNLQLHRSGRLAVFTLGADTTIGALPAKSGDLIWLYESGRLELLQSSEHITIDGKVFPAGTFIHFDIHGNVTNAPL